MDDRTRANASEIAERLQEEGRTQARIRRFWRLGLLGAGLALVLLIALIAWPRSVAYETAAVSRSALTVTVSATGTLEPKKEVEVGAEISGRIDAVYVDFNDPVTKDMPLALIDTEELQARVVQGEANLASAKATLAQAQATVVEAGAKRDRSRALARRGTLSQQELDIAEATFARGEAAVAQAEAQVRVSDALLNIERTNLGRAEVRSPIDGIVLDRKIEPGQTVAATFQTPVLFVLAEDLKRMRLNVDVDEADVGRVVAGQKATFTVDAFPDRLFEASVVSVRNAARNQDGVVTYEAPLDVANPDLLLRPGMTASAEIVVAKLDDTLTVPNAALRFTPPGLDVERVTTNDGSVKLRSIKAARRMGPQVQFKPPVVPEGWGIVWLQGGKPQPVAIKIGATDGLVTAISEGALKAGQRLLIDVKQKPNAAPSG